MAYSGPGHESHSTHRCQHERLRGAANTESAAGALVAAPGCAGVGGAATVSVRVRERKQRGQPKDNKRNTCFNQDPPVGVPCLEA